MNPDLSTCTCIREAERHVVCDNCRKLEKESLLDFLDVEISSSLFNTKNNFCNPSIHEIMENLYLSNRDAAVTKEILIERKISHILVAGGYLDMPFPNEFTYKSFSLLDIPEQNIKQYFEEAIKFIHDARKTGQTVLVHCAAGVSRSPTIVVAYLMVAKSCSFEEAYAYVKSKRSIICANSGFKSQLREFEREIKEKMFKLQLD